jgi:ankyrin repeat protein
VGGPDLGFDPDGLDEVTALHSVAGQGDEELVRLLLDRGASLKIRDSFYDGTAIEWAEFFGDTHLRDMLVDEKETTEIASLLRARADRSASRP